MHTSLDSNDICCELIPSLNDKVGIQADALAQRVDSPDSREGTSLWWDSPRRGSRLLHLLVMSRGVELPPYLKPFASQSRNCHPLRSSQGCRQRDFQNSPTAVWLLIRPSSVSEHHRELERGRWERSPGGGRDRPRWSATKSGGSAGIAVHCSCSAADLAEESLEGVGGVSSVSEGTVGQIQKLMSLIMVPVPIESGREEAAMIKKGS